MGKHISLGKDADSSGKVIITGLPPSAKLTIVVLGSEPPDWWDKMAKWMNCLREDGQPFSESVDREPQ